MTGTRIAVYVVICCLAYLTVLPLLWAGLVRFLRRRGGGR
jgi:hypothetical protein